MRLVVVLSGHGTGRPRRGRWPRMRTYR